MARSNYDQVHNLITMLEQYFPNTTFNFTENDIQILIEYVNRSNYEMILNLNRINCGNILENFAETYAKLYHAYLAISVCIFGSVVNVLNVVVLSRKEMICTPINRILMAIAVTDILVMMEYIPYVYYYHIVLPENLDFPYIGAIYMLFHAHLTQTLHTTSICLTLLLAIWRYLALSFPRKTRTLCSHFRCTIGIIISCLLPIILCIPTYATISITTKEIVEDQIKYTLYHTDLNENIKKDKTLLKLNFWIYAVFIKLLPCCILTIISIWLIRTLFETKRRKRILMNIQLFVLNEKAQEEKKRPLKIERRTERTTRMLVAVLLLFLLTEFPQGIFALLIGIKGKELFLECYQLYGAFMDILALFSGAINFILYCSMSRMFRTTFNEIITQKIIKWFRK